MTGIVFCPDIECDSCVKLISRKLEQNRLDRYAIKQDHVEFDDSQVNADEVVRLIENLGFRASLIPFERKTLKERIRHFKENKDKYEIEREGIRHSVTIFLILIGLTVFSYYGFLKDIPHFLSAFGWWMFYLIITVTTIGVGLWHFYAYRAKFTCMVGMMIGMTFGMQTGLMLGAIVGATNGFFVGSMAGMLTGSVIGFVTGRCCGVMGWMEGLMAGVMGGTMGPMISVMMFSDHLLWFMPFFMVINVIIVLGMSYMLYEEVVENNKSIVKAPLDFTTLASMSVIVMTIIAFLMIYGPKSALLSF